ncbi:MAG: AAA family ATPase [Chloroflexota bacterium]
MINADRLVNHFNLSQLPFGRAVSEAGLLHHRSFTEALARLSLAVSTRTPALFTAEPGLGKSTLLGNLADSLDKTANRIVYTQLCSCGPFGLTGQLAVRYGLRPKRSASQTAQGILDELARSGRSEVLILDEGHRLPFTTLDELRLLSNLDFDRTPPFALILAGQPPLRETLAQPELASLHQRLAIRASLSPLTEQESADYLDRRLRAAGARATIFRPQAAARIFEKTRGVLRPINNLAIASLLTAATAGKKHVDLQEVDDASFDQENF